MRWRRYFERRRRDDELAQEIAHYIAQETEDNIARGMSADDARLAAVRRFGNRQVVREAVYRMNSVNCGPRSVAPAPRGASLARR